MKLKITTVIPDDVEKGLIKLNDELSKRGASGKIFVSYTKIASNEFVVEVEYLGENFVMNKIIHSQLQKKLKSADEKIKVERL